MPTKERTDGSNRQSRLFLVVALAAAIAGIRVCDTRRFGTVELH